MRSTPETTRPMEAMERNHTPAWPKVVPAEVAASLEAEVLAWRERFPQYTYRKQDDCVALKFGN